MNKGFFSFHWFSVRVPREKIASILTFFLNNNVSYRAISFQGENVILYLDVKYRKTIDSFAKSENYELDFSQNHGFYHFLYQYRKRFGVFLGLVFLLISVFLSSSFVWKIDIQGNETISDAEIMDSMRKCGFSFGTYIPKINYDKLHNEILLSDNRLAWISVNIEGNCANVLVRETEKEDKTAKKRYNNIVAKKDGQIALIELQNGEKVVRIGDVVKEGDLLISGILDSKSKGVRYESASGIVQAYVNESIHIEIPYEQEVKIPTGNRKTVKKVSFFKNNENFSLNYNKYYKNCDKIESSKQLTLFQKIALPVFEYQISFVEYEFEPITYSKEEVVDLAYSSLREKIDTALSDGELISKEVSYSYTEKAFILDCNLYILEDIAKIQEFEIK